MGAAFGRLVAKGLVAGIEWAVQHPQIMEALVKAVLPHVVAHLDKAGAQK